MKLKTPNSKVVRFNKKYILVHCYETAVLDTIAELFDIGYVVKNSIKADGLIKKIESQ